MFHFKQFSINHSQSTMKVGTDAVLLGAWMPVPDGCRNILDMGCGCGVISLMLAQRTNAQILGIDIDEKSVIEAQKNAENSPWKERVVFIHENMQHFAQKTTQKFDVIVSNPPFFENSLKSPKKNNNLSKHNDSLTFDDIVVVVDKLLAENGCFGVIFPPDAAEKFEKLAILKSLYPTKKLFISPIPSKKVNRILTSFERKLHICEENKLTIRDSGYTNEYYQLVCKYVIS